MSDYWENTDRTDHGHYNCYTVGNCRCALCRKAAARYNKRRALLQHSGKWQPWVDAGPVRAHVESLRAAGLSTLSIAALAGVHVGSVTNLRLLGRPRARASFAAKLLAVSVSPADMPPTSRLNPAGARRRIQALVYMGWSFTELATRVGTERSTLHSLMWRPTVQASIAASVARVFEELATQAPPSGTRYEKAFATRNHRRAVALGWVSALAWDDIDDPDAVPQGVAEVSA